jgi:hypothetical protein
MENFKEYNYQFFKEKQSEKVKFTVAVAAEMV